MKTAAQIMKLCAGLFLIALGIVALHDLNQPAVDRMLPRPLQSLMWSAPALIAVGGLMSVRASTWGMAYLTSRRVRVAGLVLFGIGAALAALLVVTDPGGDASWSYGMGILFGIIALVFPGLSLVLSSFFINSGRDNPQITS